MRLGKYEKTSAFLNRLSKRVVYGLIFQKTLKLSLNKSERTKDFVLYSRDFVIAGAFYYKMYLRYLKLGSL
jgi:hypothetical protein